MKILPDYFLIWVVDKMKPRVVCQYFNKATKELVGYGVGMTLSNKKLSKDKFQDKLSQLLNCLSQEDIQIVCLDNNDRLNTKEKLEISKGLGIKFTSGEVIKTDVLPFVLDEICKMNDMDLKEQEVLIIGDSSNVTKKIACTLSKNLKFLTMMDADQSFLGELASFIFENTGLSIHIIEEVNKKLSNIRIMINLSGEIAIDSSKIKKKTIIIDFGVESPISETLLKNRRDILVIKDFIFRRPDTLLCDKEDYQFEMELNSHIYEVMKPLVDQRDLIKVQVGHQRYTLKESWETYWMIGRKCRYFATNVNKKPTVNS